ncbi:hypothetical protein CPB85DRAFT_1009742 [Mucidula mucida]|nr:hypothetical protein CPB85DRAFT_1009742 [Mucidula mucida]
MSALQYFPIQHLPMELEREIFEAAARMEPGRARHLILVARRVKTWIQPLIYELVSLGSQDVDLFMRTMGSIPSSFFAANVKKLCLTISVEPLVGTQILSTCTGLDSLALWVDFWSSDSHISVPPLLAYLPLRNLSVPLKCFHELSSDVLCRSTLLQNLVRLDLIHWDGDEFAALPDLSSTPNLTELGVIVHFHITKSYLLSLSSQCPTLRVMSVLVDEGLGIEHVPTEDPRIVFLPYPNMVPDWEASVRGFESTWTAARQVVAERLREINLSSAIDRHRLWG